VNRLHRIADVGFDRHPDLVAHCLQPAAFGHRRRNLCLGGAVA
jgi:hypothetical protein